MALVPAFGLSQGEAPGSSRKLLLLSLGEGSRRLVTQQWKQKKIHDVEATLEMKRRDINFLWVSSGADTRQAFVGKE